MGFIYGLNYPSARTKCSCDMSYESRQIFKDIASTRLLGTRYLDLRFCLPQELGHYLQLR